MGSDPKALLADPECGNGGPTTVQQKASAFTRQTAVVLALTILTSSQGLLIAMSKRAGHFDYSVTTANFMVEATKCAISLATLANIWAGQGVTEETTLMCSWAELRLYPIPAFLYLVKNLMQYYIFLYVDAPSYQVLKNLNIISTGILYRIFLQKKMNSVQWSALVLLALGCTEAQTTSKSDAVLTTSTVGILLAVIMALLSGAAGVYTELIIKKRPQRSIHVQNIYLYMFGIIFNSFTIGLYDKERVLEKGFFHGYTSIVWVMVLNHALSGLAVSMVMKWANNITKVYATSVAMLLTTMVSVPLFGFQLTLPFILGTGVVTVATFLNYKAKSLGTTS